MLKEDLKIKVLSHLREDEIIEIGKNLIRIPSFTEKEREAVFFVKDLLEKEGFETLLQEVDTNRPQIIAFLRGSGKGRSLMFNGHLDIDPITESWKWNPFEPLIKGNRLFGAGIHNMKSGIASMLASAIAIKRSKIKLDGDLIVSSVVGELQGGRGTIHMLNSGIRTDFAIVPEPYSVNNIITKCVGVHKFAINTIGKSIHISRKEIGVDSIQKMLKVIERLNHFDLGVTDPDFPGIPRHIIASIIGGRNRDYDLSGPCNLADFCTIIVDMRYPEGITPDEIDHKIIQMLEKIKEQDNEFQYEYEHPPNPRFHIGGTDMPPMNIDSDIELIKIIKNNYKFISKQEIKNTGVVLPYSYCGNDTAHLQRAGIDCCLYGPRGYSDDVEKHVRIDEMITCSRVLTTCAIDICIL